MGSITRKPIKDLEQELITVNHRKLVEDVIYNPHLSQCYILVKFYDSTSKKIQNKIQKYIKCTYDVIDVEFLKEENTLYITYDYWSRYTKER